MVNPFELAEYLKGYDPRINEVIISKDFATNNIEICVSFKTTIKYWKIVLSPYELAYNGPHSVAKKVLKHLDNILDCIPQLKPIYGIQVDPAVAKMLEKDKLLMPPNNLKDIMGKWGKMLTEQELKYLTDTATKWQEFEANKQKQVVDGKCTCQACQMGLIGVPSYGALGDKVKSEILRACPGTREKVENCPVCKRTGPLPLLDMVIHINDGHIEWDRARIADWLESLDIDIEFKEVSDGR